MKRQRLAAAGNVLMAIGTVQVAGALYFYWRAGLGGVLSPVAVLWPVAAMLVFLGGRLRKVSA